MVANGIDLKNLQAFPVGDPERIQTLKDLLKKSYVDAGIGDLWPHCDSFLMTNGF